MKTTEHDAISTFMREIWSAVEDLKTIVESSAGLNDKARRDIKHVETAIDAAKAAYSRFMSLRT